MKVNKDFMIETAEEVTPEVNEPVNPEVTPEPDKQDVEPEVVDKVEDKPEETKVEEKSNEELEGLRAEIERLKGELATKTTLENDLKELQTSLDQLKGDSDVKANKVAEYEAVLNDLVKSKVASIPEKFRELIPTNMTIREQLDWINKAEANGLFKGAANTDIEIGKPLNPKNPTQHIDVNNLTPGSILSMAYGSKK